MSQKRSNSFICGKKLLLELGEHKDASEIISSTTKVGKEAKKESTKNETEELQAEVDELFEMNDVDIDDNEDPFLPESDPLVPFTRKRSLRSDDMLLKKQKVDDIEVISKPLRFEGTKTYYESIKKASTTYSIGDACVISKHKSTIGTIISIWEEETTTKHNQFWFHYQEYYRPSKSSKELYLTPIYRDALLSNVKSKCRVVTKQSVEDIQVLEAEKDSFYWEKHYDPRTKNFVKD